MIVDDSSDLLDALKMFLQDKNYQICTVNSIELLQTELKHFKPDLIILDVKMNGNGNGREICMSIKSDTETNNIPVILMSASSESLKNYEECHADAIIEKPFNLSYLINLMEKVVAINIGKEA